MVASIFVNPLQFGPNEDFDQYPRTLDADCAKLHDLVDVVFSPAVSEMYPVQQAVFIEPPSIANQLCGAARPGHFRGMATIVLKLLNIVRPQVALFGKKDYQQLHIIRQMAGQLNLAVEIVGGETVRAPDGLALSSRNQYLDEAQRRESAFLYRTLQHIRRELIKGMSCFEALEAQAVDDLTARGWVVDYVSICNQMDLQPVTHNTQEGVILAAARLGGTRLLDNVEFTFN